MLSIVNENYCREILLKNYPNAVST